MDFKHPTGFQAAPAKQLENKSDRAIAIKLPKVDIIDATGINDEISRHDSSTSRYAQIRGLLANQQKAMEESFRKLGDTCLEAIKRCSSALYYISPVIFLSFFYTFLWLYTSTYLRVPELISVTIAGGVVMLVGLGYLTHTIIRAFMMIFGLELILKTARFATIRILVFLSPLYIFQLNLLSLGEYAVCTSSGVLTEVHHIPKSMYVEMKHRVEGSLKGIGMATETIRTQLDEALKFTEEIETTLGEINVRHEDCSSGFSTANTICTKALSIKSTVCKSFIASIIDCSGLNWDCQAFRSTKICDSFSMFDQIKLKLPTYRMIGSIAAEQLSSLNYNAHHDFNTSAFEKHQAIASFKDEAIEKLNFLNYLDIFLSIVFAIAIVKLIVEKICIMWKYKKGKDMTPKLTSTALRLISSPFTYHILIMFFSFAANAIVIILLEVLKDGWEKNPMATVNEFNLRMGQGGSILQQMIDGLLHDSSVSISKKFQKIVEFKDCYPEIHEIQIWYVVLFTVLCALGHLSYKIDDFLLSKQKRIIDWVLQRNKNIPVYKTKSCGCFQR